MVDLIGKVALVTGAAGKEGLGRAIALRLAQEGANLAVNDLGGAKSRRGSLDNVVAEIDALGKGALAVYAGRHKSGPGRAHGCGNGQSLWADRHSG